MGIMKRTGPIRRLKEDGKLIEHVIPTDAVEKLGTKYSCFEGIKKKA